MSTADRHPHFARFFRPVPGRLVARYGTARETKGNDIIGGIWVNDEDQAKPDTFANGAPRRKLKVDVDKIVPITHLEARRFRREYHRAVRNGDLEEVSRKDWEAWAKKRDAAAAKAQAELDAKAKAETTPTKSSSSLSSTRKRTQE